MKRRTVLCLVLVSAALPLAADPDSDLRAAVERREAARVREMLRSGAAVSAADSSGRTPLMLAARAGSQEILIMLLSGAAAVDAADSAGWTALMYAAASGHRPVVDDLLEAGADPRLRDSMGKTAEELAAQNGHTQVVGLLRQRRDADDQRAADRLRDRFDSVAAADLDRLIDQGSPDLRRRVLEAAFLHERTDVIRRLLARAGGPAGPDRFDLEGPRRIGSITAAPVAWCALRGDAETLEALLARGASPRASYGEKPALVLAVQAGSLRCAEALVARGAAPSAEALAAAIAARQAGAARLLLQRGASLDAAFVLGVVDQDNVELMDGLAAGTPAAAEMGDALVQAVAAARFEAARALTRSRVITRSRRAAAFLRAVEAGYLGLAELIGKDGMDGPTLDEALIIAVSRANTAAVRQLLARGASAGARASGLRDQPTALMLAARLLDIETAGVLVDAGADPAARDQAGNDAVWYARQGNADGRNPRDELKVTNRLRAALER